MNTSFRKSFERDLKKLRKDHETLSRIREAIEFVESADGLDQLSNVKKLTGGTGNYYRVRVGDYRIGIEMENDEMIFTRCLHRRDIYRYFP